MFATQLLIAALAFTGTHAMKVQESLGQHREINLAQSWLPQDVDLPSEWRRPDEQHAIIECTDPYLPYVMNKYVKIDLDKPWTLYTCMQDLFAKMDECVRIDRCVEKLSEGCFKDCEIKTYVDG